jgi:hypothetical protein
VLQPAQRARPGTLPAPAAPAGNAQQRLRADQHRVLPPGLGGDMAAMRGIAKFLLQWEREAQPRASRRCSTTPSSPSTPVASTITWRWSTPRPGSISSSSPA